MRCSDFLRLYSDYRDGLIDDPSLATDVRHHLASCSKCMDYDASVARGVMLLKATSDIGPSLNFRRRLESRLYRGDGEPEPGDAARSLHAGIMVVLMMAAAIALAVGTGSDRDGGTAPADLASANSAAPAVSSSVAAGGLVDLTDLSVPAYGTDVAGQSQSQISFTTWVSLSR